MDCRIFTETLRFLILTEQDPVDLGKLKIEFCRRLKAKGIEEEFDSGKVTLSELKEGKYKRFFQNNLFKVITPFDWVRKITQAAVIRAEQD